MNISHEEWMRLCNEADAEMKKNNGHQFMVILKTRCGHCGRSPKQKGKCPHWMLTYVQILREKVNEFLTGKPTLTDRIHARMCLGVVTEGDPIE